MEGGHTGGESLFRAACAGDPEPRKEMKRSRPPNKAPTSSASHSSILARFLFLAFRFVYLTFYFSFSLFTTACGFVILPGPHALESHAPFRSLHNDPASRYLPQNCTHKCCRKTVLAFECILGFEPNMASPLGKLPFRGQCRVCTTQFEGKEVTRLLVVHQERVSTPILR